MSRKSRKGRPTRSRRTVPGKDVISAPARETKAGQTEIRSIVLDELSVARSEFFSGPLPLPDHLREYENILPGSADRVIKMAEDQAQHRRRLEESVINSNTKLEARGQILGFVIAMTALLGGGYIIASGQSFWGAAVVITAVTGLSGLFVWKSRERKRELNEQKGVGTIPGPVPPPEPPQEPQQ